LDYESQASRDLGCWNAEEALGPVLYLTSAQFADPSWELPSALTDAVNGSGFGQGITETQKTFWTETIKKIYQGDEGRRRLRQAVINLKDRDGLHSRLSDLNLPVLRMHGDKDVVYSVKHAEKEMELLNHLKVTKFVVVEGGAHYLSATNPKEVDEAVLRFIMEN
jgi:pimeloyl-ACP methyl ester carboxylesterase